MNRRDEKEFQRKIGQHVRVLRLERKISQEAFAASCGLHRTHMSLMERGLVNMTVNTLKTVADALGVRLSEFFHAIE